MKEYTHTIPCPCCGGNVVPVKGVEPYSSDHFQCEKCDGTFAEHPLIEENARLRTALAFYRDERNWLVQPGDPCSAIIADTGTRAKKALEASVVCDDCQICVPVGSDALGDWLVVTKNISEVGDPQSRFTVREFYCPKCRKAHE